VGRSVREVEHTLVEIDCEGVENTPVWLDCEGGREYTGATGMSPYSSTTE
jgi:hypothetical protein